jgi:hypothetical protein
MQLGTQLQEALVCDGVLRYGAWPDFGGLCADSIQAPPQPGYDNVAVSMSLIVAKNVLGCA